MGVKELEAMFADVVVPAKVNGNGHAEWETHREAALAGSPKERSESLQDMTLAVWQGACLEVAKDLLRRSDLEYLRDGQPANRDSLVMLIASAVNHAPRVSDLRWPAGFPEEELEGALTAVADLALRNFVVKVPVKTAPLAAKPSEATLPQVFIRNKIEILKWGELRERRQAHTQNWVVQGWLARGETSMWSGKVEHGKTTLMRELTLCKVRGEPFLGHECPAGRVFYAMLDADGEDLTYDEFEKMGMTDEDQENIRFLFEPMIARMENGPEQFFQALWEWRPDIVIIDPFARLKEIGDFNDYNNTYLMAMLSQYAKVVNAHFALPGHIPRGRPAGASAATAAFGSVAFGAGVNARFVVERKDGTDIHVLRTSKGKSAGFEAMEGDQVLVRDSYTGRISLGKAFSFGHQAAALKSKVLEVVNDAPLQDWTPAALGKEMGQPPGLIRAALGMLFDDGHIDRSGTGKKGDKHQFQKRIQRGESAGVKRDENETEKGWFSN